MTRLRLEWLPRAAPLATRAVIATAEAARALGHRIAALDDESLRALSAVAAEDVLLAIGDALPWADGVTYLGRDDAAPGLLLPTALAPTIPAPVLQQAIATRTDARLVAVLPGCIVPCDRAREIERDRLRAWLEAR